MVQGGCFIRFISKLFFSAFDSHAKIDFLQQVFNLWIFAVCAVECHSFVQISASCEAFKACKDSGEKKCRFFAHFFRDA